ncbi:Uncharacterised protein [Vibrio cholerae]|nr:Uncharacterised protein [Vibrio cholerae]
MSHRKTPTHQHVKTDQLAIFTNRDKVQVIGVHIHIIVWRDHNSRFELTRQIV